MAVARKSTSRPAGTEQQLRGFVAEFEPAHQALIRAARRDLRRRMPTAFEMVYDNYNFFVIGYSPTERPSDAVLSLAAGANGVGVCFIHGAALPDPDKLLQGSGNQTRFIRLESAKVLCRPAVDKLLAAAIAAARRPFAKTGRVQLIIRSISAKRRPRRRSPCRSALNPGGATRNRRVPPSRR